MKYDLPVIILKGVVLLPNNEVRIDVNVNQNILDTSEMFHDNKILIATDLNKIEERIKDLL